MSFWKSHPFKKLNRKWRERLKKAGFRDLEDDSGKLTHEGTVVQDLSRRASFRADLVEETRQYFSWAEDMANHARFQSTLDKKIWALHAKGESLREIAEHLPVRLDHTTIGDRIHRIRDYLRLHAKQSRIA